MRFLADTPKQDELDGTAWSNGGYRPTPTIIEAAQALYRQHKVEDIARSDAGARNLTDTTHCIAEIIEDAKAKDHKDICFVTGVPGAGKTLAGLNLVTERTVAHEDEHTMVDGHWSHHRFRGTAWQKVNDSSRRAYLASAYRVLMTRAQQGMVIYVPPGAVDDYTRPPEFNDGVAAFLQNCGIEALTR